MAKKKRGTTAGRLKSKLLLRVGFNLLKRGLVDSHSPGIEKICEAILRGSGVATPMVKPEQWALIYQYAGAIPPSPRIKKIPSSPGLSQATRVAFYGSDEWRAVRYQAILKYGTTCQCCGAPKGPETRIHVDHVKPRSKFPGLSLELSNLQILCEDCNLGKSNRDQTDWRDL